MIASHICGITYSPTLPPPALLGDAHFSGDKRISQQESVILNAAALLVNCPSEYHAPTDFLEADFRGVRDCTSTSSPLYAQVKL